jgi:hypothetical protein
VTGHHHISAAAYHGGFSPELHRADCAAYLYRPTHGATVFFFVPNILFPTVAFFFCLLAREKPESPKKNTEHHKEYVSSRQAQQCHPAYQDPCA